ncbi:hypothetical protein NG42_16000 [Winslowiella iniecta]|uniref:Uncharacterized protein n=1 Tax=Winslowiella iniecta TaxID=1560201 RepID=A0A0L7SZF3_9GAMM|nr:hypothetical protein NG42_16000 [Winslowiella iniecta]KOC90561.1 hypothetical protein NG43_16990 [Winslowiella iniecta]
MERRSVPTGIKFLISIIIFASAFLLIRPATPLSDKQFYFWQKAALFFGDNDIEGFIGQTLLITDIVVTIIVYLIVIRCVERRT